MIRPRLKTPVIDRVSFLIFTAAVNPAGGQHLFVLAMNMNRTDRPVQFRGVWIPLTSGLFGVANIVVGTGLLHLSYGLTLLKAVKTLISQNTVVTMKFTFNMATRIHGCWP